MSRASATVDIGTHTFLSELCGAAAYSAKRGIEWKQEKSEYLHVNYLNEPEQVIVRGHGSGVYPAVERLFHLPHGHGEALTDAWGKLYSQLRWRHAAKAGSCRKA